MLLSGNTIEYHASNLTYFLVIQKVLLGVCTGVCGCTVQVSVSVYHKRALHTVTILYYVIENTLANTIDGTHAGHDGKDGCNTINIIIRQIIKFIHMIGLNASHDRILPKSLHLA